MRLFGEANLYKFMQIYKTQRANRKMSIFTQV